MSINRFFIGLLIPGLLITAWAPVAMAADKAPAPAPAPAAAPAAPPAPAGPVDIRQVQVQVWISETTEEGLRDIGNNLDYTRFVRGEEQNGSLQQVSADLFDPTSDFSEVTVPIPESHDGDPAFNSTLRSQDANAPNKVTDREGFGLSYSIINPGYGTVDGVFRSIEDKADVDLISKPELLVVNNVSATIKAGGQVPYQTVTYPKGTPNLSVAWRDIGVNLALVPTILSDEMVQLNISQLEISDMNRIENLRGVDLPVFSKRSQTGVVYVPDGQTLVIGGLSSRAVRKSERRIPLIGALPVIGAPFRRRRSEAAVTHLLVFVSPTIVDLRNMNDRSYSAMQFWKARGGEWANLERIEQEVDVMQNEI